jgi:uncharacterized protein
MMILRNRLFFILSIGSLLSIYLFSCIFLYFYQIEFIFSPRREITSNPQELGLAYEEIFIPVTNPDRSIEEIHAWLMIGSKSQPKYLLYLHGCCENISKNIEQARQFQQRGFSVLLIDYRGFGKSGGYSPSEEKAYADVLSAWNYLIKQRQAKPSEILIYGNSLGGAIAINLAAMQPEAMGLIVESSFSSMTEMIKERPIPPIFPVNLLLHQKFDSITKINSLKIPLLFIHGKKDNVTPFRMTEELYAIAPNPKKLVLIPEGGHFDSAMHDQNYWYEVDKFVESL